MPHYTLHILAIATLCLLAACSSDDPLEPSQPEQPQQMPIKFANNTMSTVSASRATGLEEVGVTDFYVWGYKTKDYDSGTKVYSGLETVMDRYRVQWAPNTAGTTATNGYDWEYMGITDHGQTQNIKYWDFLASSYRYFGIAPCSSDVITYGMNAAKDEYDITFKADATDVEHAPYISKLWFDSSYPTYTKYGQTVVMEFMKPVTKVRIELYYDNGALIKDPSANGITELSFGPSDASAIVQKGTLKVSYPLQGVITYTQYLPKLTIEGDPMGSIVIDRLKAISDTDDDDYHDWYYVLPHILQGSYQLILEQSGKTRVASVPSEQMSWHPNTEYTYRFKITGSEVQFIDVVQIGVTEWQYESSQHPIYNW